MDFREEPSTSTKSLVTIPFRDTLIATNFMPHPDPLPLPPANTPEPPEPSPPEEPTPMLDVHPAHHAASTWRDFFIHIATITVGLLIAISLEQSVEALHHRHQRHQLEYDLRVEARKNLHIVDLDYKFYDDKAAALAALRRYIDDTRTRRIAKLPPPIQPPPELGSPLFGFPITSTWKTAKESSLVPLLPRNLAAMFEEVYFENDRMTTFADEYFVALGKQRKFAARFLDPGKPVDQDTFVESVSADTLARMSPDELKLYSGLISDALDALQESHYVTMLAKDSSNAVLSGASSPEELYRHLGDNTSANFK